MTDRAAVLTITFALVLFAAVQLAAVAFYACGGSGWRRKEQRR